MRKSFGPTEIIRGVNLDSRAGERHAIIGPNGAGKSTLFNLISGRFAPTARRDPAERRSASTGMRPYEINRLRPVAQLPDHQHLSAAVGVREPALRACCGRWATATRSGSASTACATPASAPSRSSSRSA